MKHFDLFSGYKWGNRYIKTPTPPKKELVELHHDQMMTYGEIANYYNVTIKIVQRWFRQSEIVAREAYKRYQDRELNDYWKGDDAGYSAFHRRLDAKFGRIKKCDVCGTNDETRWYDWANLTGDYKNINDYKRMCRQCHRQYDESRK